MYVDDTIAAIATPPGAGGIGIVRVSGPLSVAIAGRLFAASSRPGDWTSHQLHHGHILSETADILDEGMAVLMRRPRSYTGEDVLEIHCHGSPVLLRQVLAQALRCGARLAEPGEFTKRAFLNGRIDLTQAEAVLDVVRARTRAGAARATEQLTGRLSEHLATIRTQLVELKALLEAQIDFADEDLDVPTAQLASTTYGCIVTINKLLDTFRQGRLLREGLHVAIIGKPNVGKSSLLNALLGEERAIVTPFAGTTRDAIEEGADFAGVPVILADTAGLRGAGQMDVAERLGIERTTAKMATADVLLVVLDASAPLDAQDRAVLDAAVDSLRVVVLNKIDLPREVGDEEVAAAAGGHPVVAVSATERLGLDALRRTLVEQVDSGNAIDTNGPMLTNVRHRDALEKTRQSLTLVLRSIDRAVPADLIAVDVQNGIDYMSEITGGITSEEVLDRIFSEFCIGK